VRLLHLRYDGICVSRVGRLMLVFWRGREGGIEFQSALDSSSAIDVGAGPYMYLLAVRECLFASPVDPVWQSQVCRLCAAEQEGHSGGG